MGTVHVFVLPNVTIETGTLNSQDKLYSKCGYSYTVNGIYDCTALNFTIASPANVIYVGACLPVMSTVNVTVRYCSTMLHVFLLLYQVSQWRRLVERSA